MGVRGSAHKLRSPFTAEVGRVPVCGNPALSPLAHGEICTG